MARRLILIRHSIPAIVRERPAAEWRLSADGIAQARAFATRIDPGTAAGLHSSVEPKASETAAVLAEAWGIPAREVAGLHEHERPDAQIYTREEFEARIRQMFERPSELVFGVETANQARMRFTRAALRLIQASRDDVIVVSHGTVMALFVAACTGRDTFSLWKQQQMPCAYTLLLPELTLERLTSPGDAGT